MMRVARVTPVALATSAPRQAPFSARVRDDAQRVLLVGGHDRAPRAARVRVALAAGELGQQPLAPALRLARPERHRVGMHLHEAILGPHADHADAQPLAQPDIALEGAPPRPALPARDSDIDGVGYRLPCHGLLQEGKGEAGFQLHQQRLFPVAAGHHVRRADLGLDLVAQRFEPRFDRRVEVGFGQSAHGPQTSRGRGRLANAGNTIERAAWRGYPVAGLCRRQP